MYVHPNCTNFAMELANYVWDKNKEGKFINKPIDEYNYLIDAL
ncbi:terminase large subunit [Niallia sp. Sow4_A1]|nr:terminase large subunit [Niallia sp. MER TA 168]